MSPQFTAVCECGRTNTVRPDMMGGRHPCYCGFMLNIPTAAEFERNPEQKAYPSLVRKVSAQVQAGELPGTTACQGCGTATDGEVFAVVACESSRSSTSGGNVAASIVLVVFSILFAPVIIFLRPDPGVTEQHGRDTSVRVPLRLCDGCHRRRTSRGIPLALGLLAGGAAVSVVVGIVAGGWAVLPAVMTVLAVGVVVQIRRRRQAAACKALLTPVPAYAELLTTYRFADVQLPPAG